MHYKVFHFTKSKHHINIYLLLGVATDIICRGEWRKVKRKISSVSEGVNNVNMVIFRYSAYFRG